MQGNGTLRLYVSESATDAQRAAVVRIFSGKAKGSGPFELFALGAGPLSFDHTGQNGFYARLEFAGP